MRPVRAALLSLVLATSALTASAGPASAVVEPVTTYVVPSDWTAETLDCTGGVADAAVHTVFGPGEPPIGAGSVSLTAATGSYAALGRSISSLATLTTFDLSGYAPTGQLRIGFILPGNRHLVYTLTAASWTHVDLVAAPYEYYSDPSADPVTTTIGGFLASNGDTPATVAISAFGCNVGTTVYVDDLAFAADGNAATRYDFEAKHEMQINPYASPGTLTFGQPTTLTAEMFQDGDPIGAGFYAELWKKPSGGSWTKVGTFENPNLEDPTFRVVQKPSVTTAYQWRFPGDSLRWPAVSPTTTVKVRSLVTLALADTTLHPGQTLIASGKVSPAKGGYLATLWRVTPSGKVKLGTGIIRATGAYRITKVLKAKGTYKVLVTVPAAIGNLAGTSATRSAKVS